MVSFLRSKRSDTYGPGQEWNRNWWRTNREDLVGKRLPPCHPLLLPTSWWPWKSESGPDFKVGGEILGKTMRHRDGFPSKLWKRLRITRSNRHAHGGAEGVSLWSRRPTPGVSLCSHRGFPSKLWKRITRPTPGVSFVHTQRQCAGATTRPPYQSVSLDGDAFRPSYPHLWLTIKTCVKSVWKEQCVKQHRFLTCNNTK